MHVGERSWVRRARTHSYMYSHEMGFDSRASTTVTMFTTLATENTRPNRQRDKPILMWTCMRVNPARKNTTTNTSVALYACVSVFSVLIFQHDRRCLALSGFSICVCVRVCVDRGTQSIALMRAAYSPALSELFRCMRASFAVVCVYLFDCV